MPRRLPAGNRVVGRRERDDPGRVPGRGAPVGVRGLVELGALDGPADRVVAEPAAARPVPVHLRERGAHHPDGRLPAGEDLHDPAAAPGPAVGTPPHVVGAQPDAVPAGEIRVGRGVGPGPFRRLGRPGAEALYPGGGGSAGPPRARGRARRARPSGCPARRPYPPGPAPTAATGAVGRTRPASPHSMWADVAILNWTVG